MKKVFVFLLLLTPLYGFSQNLELGINGGISINTLPVLLKSNPLNTQYKQSGISPFVQVYANHKIDRRLKAGLAINYLSASASETRTRYYAGSHQLTSTQTDKILSSIFQIMPELIFTAVSHNTSFDFGIQIGASVYSAKHATVGIVEFTRLSDNSSNIKVGYSAGIILRASQKITKSLSLNLSLNPVYNHLHLSKNLSYTMISGLDKDYSFFTFPASLGVAITL